MTQNELGKYEVQDQIAAAQYFGSKDFIDDSRMGIWGWSYGGFMAANSLFQGADTFEMAIAVAPVTSWRFMTPFIRSVIWARLRKMLPVMMKTHL